MGAAQGVVVQPALCVVAEAEAAQAASAFSTCRYRRWQALFPSQLEAVGLVGQLARPTTQMEQPEGRAERRLLAPSASVLVVTVVAAAQPQVVVAAGILAAFLMRLPMSRLVDLALGLTARLPAHLPHQARNFRIARAAVAVLA